MISMSKKINIDTLDKKMQKDGWTFLGAILHYDKAYKNQASVYKKDGKYVVSGIDSTGNNELFEPISKKEAEKRVEESINEIKKYMFKSKL
jgi:hypothetical protein